MTINFIKIKVGAVYVRKMSSKKSGPKSRRRFRNNKFPVVRVISKLKSGDYPLQVLDLGYLNRFSKVFHPKKDPMPMFYPASFTLRELTGIERAQIAMKLFEQGDAK